MTDPRFVKDVERVKQEADGNGSVGKKPRLGFDGDGGGFKNPFTQAVKEKKAVVLSDDDDNDADDDDDEENEDSIQNDGPNPLKKSKRVTFAPDDGSQRPVVRKRGKKRLGSPR